jgi:AAA domain-containing protein/bifunctional DNA primase/polymerase-like protein
MTAAKKLDPPTPLEAARALTARGWRVFPCEYMGKRPAVGIKWSTAAASAPTDATLALWFGRDPVNIAVAARWSNLVILDEDQLGAMEQLCEAYGQSVPKTYRVRTAKGWHWYFAAPQGVDIGNAPGLLAEFGFDVRGGKGAHREAGGYVVAAGSVHASGHIYVAEDDNAEVIELPGWITELLLVNPEPSGLQKAGSTEPDREHRFTHDQAAAYVERYAIGPLKAAPAPVGEKPGGRNNALNNAALLVGHFVPTFWPEDWAVERLTELAEEIGLERHEIDPTIRSGMRAGMAQPYTLVEHDPFMSASDSSGHEAGADAFEQAVRYRLEQLRVDEEARRLWAAEKRAARPSIESGLIDDLDMIEPPKMLMDLLIPDAAIGFLSGRSGAYKSFLLTSWACCIALGRPWLGQDEFTVLEPRKTLYVAAEGAAGAAGRIRAWEATNRVSRRGELKLYPRPIHLNDSDQAEELAEVIERHEIRHLFVDTYRRAAPGSDENNSPDFGRVFEAVARLRDDFGCGVTFADHTGHNGDGRPVGAEAKIASSDYVLSTMYSGTTRGPEVQRELFVIKLKDEESTGRWPIKLTSVPRQEFPVVEIGTAEASSPFAIRDDGEWWRPDIVPEIPDDVQEKIKKEANKNDNRGRGADAARWVWRYLASIDDEQGATRAQINQRLEEIPLPIKKSTIDKAIPILDHAGLVERDRTRVWLAKG